MATGFLILHGVQNHRPPERWQFLVAAQLVEQGHEVRYPTLPEPDVPEPEGWLATLEQEFAALGVHATIVDGAGHIAPGSGYRPWPSVASAPDRRHDAAVLGALRSQWHVARSPSGRLRLAGS